MIWKYFYSQRPAGEHGTMYQLHNLINRRKVVRNPEKNFNSCDDFFELVSDCFILTAALEVLEMKSLTDIPSEAVISNPRNVWMEED